LGLLSPTRIYAKALKPVFEAKAIKGLAHITGGGLVENTPRALPNELAAEFDWSAWKRPAVFEWLQATGDVPEEDMRRTFNLGVGMILVVEPAKADEPLYVWRPHREKIYIGGDEARYRSTHVAMTWISLLLKVAGNKSLDQLNLSAKDRASVLNDCTLWARLLYSQDRSAFADYLVMARKLDPHIAPSYPKYVARASRYVGFENAEAIAKLGRTPKTFARKALQKLNLRPQNSLFDWN